MTDDCRLTVRAELAVGAAEAPQGDRVCIAAGEEAHQDPVAIHLESVRLRVVVEAVEFLRGSSAPRAVAALAVPGRIGWHESQSACCTRAATFAGAKPKCSAPPNTCPSKLPSKPLPKTSE